MCLCLWDFDIPGNQGSLPLPNFDDIITWSWLMLKSAERPLFFFFFFFFLLIVCLFFCFGKLEVWDIFFLSLWLSVTASYSNLQTPTRTSLYGSHLIGWYWKIWIPGWRREVFVKFLGQFPAGRASAITLCFHCHLLARTDRTLLIWFQLPV